MPVVAPTLDRPSAVEAIASDALQGIQWTLVEFGGKAHPGAVRAPHLTFQSDGRFSGSTGCNRVNGPYSADEAALTFGPAATTRMACMGEGMQTEAAFLKMLEAVAGWRAEGGRLHLLDGAGQTLATFAAD